MSNEGNNTFSKYPTINQTLPESPLYQCQAVEATHATTSTRSNQVDTLSNEPAVAENVDEMNDNDDKVTVNIEDFHLIFVSTQPQRIFYVIVTQFETTKLIAIVFIRQYCADGLCNGRLRVLMQTTDWKRTQEIRNDDRGTNRSPSQYK